MAYTGKTKQMIAEELAKKTSVRTPDNTAISNNPLEERLMGSSERKIAVGYTIEPTVKEKIIRLAKSHGYKSASAFINDVFKQW